MYIRSISIPESANSSMYIFKNISIPLQILRFREEGRWFVIYILILSEEGENPNTRETFSWCESTNELFFRPLVSWNSRIRDEIWKFRCPRSSNGRRFEIEGKNVVGRGGEGRERTGNPRQGHMPVRKVALLEDDDPSTPAGFRPTPLVRAPLTTSRLSPLVLLLHRKVFHYLLSSSYFSSTSSFPRFVFKERINNCPDYGSGFDRVRSWRVWKIEYYRFTDGVAEIFISWKVSILNFKRIDGCSINL